MTQKVNNIITKTTTINLRISDPTFYYIYTKQKFHYPSTFSLFPLQKIITFSSGYFQNFLYKPKTMFKAKG
jgi:hypothetical protein